MRILITGGAGRLGMTVCKTFLQDGFEVRILDLDTPQNHKRIQKLAARVEVMWGDITHP
ncbi:MAG TPA: NAD(P)-dependent oxidoreductase, partial [Dehalococcoidia bacterium]|nr:NAD(P)-dependent oxidoreductase [Dehalococcoidia bacterium]